MRLLRTILVAWSRRKPDWSTFKIARRELRNNLYRKNISKSSTGDDNKIQLERKGNLEKGRASVR